jgi:hypothetical protein
MALAVGDVAFFGGVEMTSFHMGLQSDDALRLLLE